MARVVPFYLSTSRSATFLWAFPLFVTFWILFFLAPTWALMGLLIWGVLQGTFLFLIQWQRQKDLPRLSKAEPIRLEPVTATKAILLLHGFVDQPLAWQRQANYLMSKGYAVVAPYLDHEAPETWRPMLEAELTSLCKQYAHVELWGHSMGGALALALSPHFPLKRVVLWAPFLAPFLTRPLTTFIYVLHRLLFFGSRTFTFFPSRRRGKGVPSTCYYVACTLPIRTFATMLQMQYLAVAASPSAPLLILLSHREKVVSNQAILRHFPLAPMLWAKSPSTGHQLTNAEDWLENLNRVQKR